MAGNDWINSYLEAILDVGPALDDKKSSLLLRERGRFSPTRYFVEEVITGFDETDLYRSWVKVRSEWTLVSIVRDLERFLSASLFGLCAGLLTMSSCLCCLCWELSGPGDEEPPGEEY